MSINSYPNSDPKQCTVSKLGSCCSVLRVVVPCRIVVSRTAVSCRSAQVVPYRDTKNRVAIQNNVMRTARCVTRALLCAPTRRPGRVVPWRVPAPCLLCCDQSWKMGSSPSSFLSCTFFFSLFFSFVLPIVKPQKFFFFQIFQ